MLQNNGGDSLALSGNGPFTFPVAVGSGSAYRVTVLSHPSGQVCSVTNDTGTASSAVTDVSVQCMASSGTWEGAELRESLSKGVDGSSAQVRFDAAGNAILVWTQASGSTIRHLWASHYSPVAGWSAPQIQDAGTGSVSGSDLAVEPGGDAVLVWSEYESSTFTYNLWARRRVAGLWQAPVLLENDPQWAIGAQVQLDGSGNARAVWMKRENDGSLRVVGARLHSGTWRPPEQLSTSPSGQVRLTLHTNGTADLVWDQPSGSTQAFWSRHFDGSAWSVPAPVPGTLGGSDLQLASDHNGGTFMVWTVDNGSSSDVFASQRSAGGAWTVPQQMRTSSNTWASYGTVAMNASGQAVFVWIEDEGGASGLWTRSLLPGSGWGAATRLELPGGGGLNPRVAINDAGEVLIGWARNVSGTGLDADMVAWRGNVAAPGSWAGPVVLSQGSQAGATWGDVALDPLGRGIAVWQQFDAARSGLLDLWSNVLR